MARMCPSSGITSLLTAVATPSGEPGRQNSALPLATPAIALLIMADDPMLSWLIFRKSSPNPGISFSSSGVMASTVTSEGAMPVPPVITIASAPDRMAFLAVVRMTRIRSGMRVRPKMVCPSARKSDSILSPEGSSTQCPLCFCVAFDVLHVMMNIEIDLGAYCLCSEGMSNLLFARVCFSIKHQSRCRFLARVF